ncbi:MAG: hypothetical protein ACKOUS_03625, partial [Alphaproteobacteria bacterium]
MSEWILPLASIALANLLGAMSPGPAFVLVLRTALAHGREAAWAPIAGLAVGAQAALRPCASAVLSTRTKAGPGDIAPSRFASAIDASGRIQSLTARPGGRGSHRVRAARDGGDARAA